MTSLRSNGLHECAPDDRLREAFHRPRRRCERSEAIHRPRKGRMDCFAALAMTVSGQWHSTARHTRSRHRPPTGRASARPMTGSSKQSIAPAVIASEAKQSILPHKERMDCFAALAMTARASNTRLRPRGTMRPRSYLNLPPKEGVGNAGCPWCRKPEAVERRFFIPTADARKRAGCNSRDTISASSIASGGRKTKFFSMGSRGNRGIAGQPNRDAS